MSEMIERVAKAIIGAMFAEHELPLDDEIYQKYLTTARAAIEAMREPTEEMVSGGDQALDWDSDDRSGIWFVRFRDGDSAKSWRAMIDTALGNP